MRGKKLGPGTSKDLRAETREIAEAAGLEYDEQPNKLNPVTAWPIRVCLNFANLTPAYFGLPWVSNTAESSSPVRTHQTRTETQIEHPSTMSPASNTSKEAEITRVFGMHNLVPTVTPDACARRPQP